MKIEDVLQNRKEFLMSFRNVVGIGKGTKRIRGKDTKRECIVVFVAKKVPEIELSRDDVLPRSVNEIETDVVEVGEVRIQPALEATVANREKHRPVLGGLSISPGKFLLAGTGGLIVIRDNQPFILSNNHVLRLSQIYNPDDRPQRGDYIRQPSFVDDGKPEDSIGELWDWVEVVFPGPNEVDCAIGKLKESFFARILGLGTPLGIAPAVINKKVFKSGRTSGITQGKITYTNVTISVDYGIKEAAIFEDQIMSEPFAEAGDSGSIWLDENNFVVGLHFAGSKACSIANPIAKVFEKLNLSLPEVTGEELVDEALKDIDYEIVWGFKNEIKEWKFYDPNAPWASDLRFFIPGCGYWILSKREQKLKHGEYEWTLYKGWNLIGWR